MDLPTLSDDLADHHKMLSTYTHKQPHQYLGLHSLEEKKVIRIIRPDIDEAYIELRGKNIPMEKIDPIGIFSLEVDPSTHWKDYKVFYPSNRLAHDPYAIPSLVDIKEIELFQKGIHYDLYRMLGAHRMIFEGIEGIRFALWAPNALSAYLVGDFNFWDGRMLPMQDVGGGVFEIFIPGLENLERYKFEIRTKEGYVRIKSDPFGFYFEKRPKTASICYDMDSFCWEDDSWLEKRRDHLEAAPLHIYEMHLGSWKKQNEFRNYRELAPELASYVKEMGFTHVEILPIAEHPLDESWGYQVTGFYAPTSRYGTPEDFQFFVNYMHKEGIGVLLDWVPGHFPADEHALARFDGTALFEHEHPYKGLHPHWHTLIFDYGKPQVSNFLIANALFWLEIMHIDGLRVDAVASMLYLDFGREDGKWFPNQFGGNYNLEAIEFLKHLNSIVHKRQPGVLMIAEESSAFKGVTQSVEREGLGFDLKWNLGWMNDTLRFFSTDPIFRKHNHEMLTFGMFYAYSEKFISVLSHDEVVHEKKSLFAKMPGDEWQKFANLRTLYCYMVCMVGKQLLFMGGEIAQPTEWNVKLQIPWELLQKPFHEKYHFFVRSMNHFYLENKALWEYDFDRRGFDWIDFSDVNVSVISFLRRGNKQQLAVIHNFTPVYRRDYFIKLQNLSSITEVFNSDREEFGGSGKINESIPLVHDEKGKSVGFSCHLPPLATVIVEVTFHETT